MRSVFFIPTNRDCTAAIASYAKEVTHAATSRGIQVPLVVVETDDGPHVSANAAAVARARTEHSEITAFHFTHDLQRAYFSELLMEEPVEVRELFLNPGKNYGTAMNKLFLMAGSFDADAFHRRDSDTRLVFDEVPGAPLRYPIDIELDHLGKRVGDLRHPWYNSVPPSMYDREVWVTGGNYVGEWCLDVKDFARRSNAPIHRLYEILGFPPDAVVDFCAEAFPPEPDFEPHDEISLVTSVSDSRNSDGGNVAVYRLHELLPTIPGRDMLGADYFAFDAATALGMPSVHHTAPVFHRYSDARFCPDEKLRYWEGVARFADYFATHAPIIDSDLATQLRLSGSVTITDDVVAVVRQMLPAIRTTDPAERVARIVRIADEVLIPFDARYGAIGRSLIASAERIVAECNEDYARHELLVERWPALVARSKTIRLAPGAFSLEPAQGPAHEERDIGGSIGL